MRVVAEKVVTLSIAVPHLVVFCEIDDDGPRRRQANRFKRVASWLICSPDYRLRWPWTLVSSIISRQVLRFWITEIMMMPWEEIIHRRWRDNWTSSRWQQRHSECCAVSSWLIGIQGHHLRRKPSSPIGILMSVSERKLTGR